MNECKFEGCAKKAKTIVRGLCVGHEWQRAQGYELKPLKEYNSSDIGVEGYRQCTKCKKVKETSDFYKRQNGKLRGHCKACAIKMVQANQRRAQEASNAH